MEISFFAVQLLGIKLEKEFPISNEIQNNFVLLVESSVVVFSSTELATEYRIPFVKFLLLLLNCCVLPTIR